MKRFQTSFAGEVSKASDVLVAVHVRSDELADRIRSIAAEQVSRVVAVAGGLESIVDELSGEVGVCVILASRHISTDALGWISTLREQLDDPGILLVCNEADPVDARRLVEIGAGGLVLVEELDRALPAAIAAVVAGQACIPRRRGEHLLRALTGRERQMLGFVAIGMTNAEIASRLFVAESTVKSHLSSAFSKLGVSSRNEAARLILDPDRGRGLGIPTVPPEQVPSPF